MIMTTHIDIIHLSLDQCQSTQAELKNYLSQHPKLGLPVLVSTVKQPDGRGRRGNRWIKVKNALAFSFAFKSEWALSLTPLVIGVALNKYFENTLNKETQLKWPNDILLNGKKFGGILCEHLGDNIVSVGIGINLGALNKLEVQELDSFLATSLVPDWQLEAQDFHRIPYEFLQFFLQQQNIIQMPAEWNSRCVHLKSMVKIEDGQTLNVGIFEGIGEMGEAILSQDGKFKKIYSGTLRLV